MGLARGPAKRFFIVFRSLRIAIGRAYRGAGAYEWSTFSHSGLQMGLANRCFKKRRKSPRNNVSDGKFEVLTGIAAADSTILAKSANLV